MNRFDALKRWTWSVFIVFTLAFAFAGCEGDDGATGPQGPPGPPGADGQDGQDGADITQTALESCGVCHSDNSVASATVAHALPPIEAVSNVVFATANAGADLTVSFDLADSGNAGAPLMDYDEGPVWGVYANNGGGVVVSYTSAATLANNGNGNYTITLAGAGPEAAVDTRWIFRIRDSVVDWTSDTYFHADFPNNPFAADGPLVVTGAACQACHGPEGIAVHFSNFIASDGAEPCLTCHGADDSPFGAPPGPNPVPSLVTVAHEYHSGLREEITYPTYMNNCSVCHEPPDNLAAANSMSVNADACFTCHGSTETMFAPDDPLYVGLHDGFTSNCESCHVAGQIASSVLVVTDAHNGSITERSGVIWDGEDLSVTEGALIDWRITGVADDGTNLTITWQADYNGTGVDPCNVTPGATTPLFFADEDADGDSLGNLSILRNYAQGEDFILGTEPEEAGQPGSSPGVTNDNTTCAANVATTVVPVEETDATVGRLAIQGKPRLPSPDPDDTDGLMQVRAKTPTFDWLVGVGGKADDRRQVVDTGLCLNCHVGSLYQHGGNRVDNVDMCMLCHNVAANDEYVRVNEIGVDASESYDGRAGQAFGMKEMAHGIHPAGATGNPIVIYRNRGIYAWADDVSKLNNWPTETNCTDRFGRPGSVVAGADDPTATNACQVHTFHAPTYPRGLYECAACHVQDDPATAVDEGFAVLPDPTIAMATTVEAGAPPFGNQINDVLQGVQTTSCVSCHADGAAKGHAYQNGWTPQAFPEGRQTIIDTQ